MSGDLIHGVVSGGRKEWSPVSILRRSEKMINDYMKKVSQLGFKSIFLLGDSDDHSSS